MPLLVIAFGAALLAASAFLPLKQPLLWIGAWPDAPNAWPLMHWKAFTFGSVGTSAQLVMLLAVAALLGPRRGFVSAGVYLALGLLGLPVFAGGGGMRYLAEPAFFSLLAFLPAAAVAGRAAKQAAFGRTWLGMLAALAWVWGGSLLGELLHGHALPQWAMRQWLPFLGGTLAAMTLLAALSSGARKLARAWRQAGANRRAKARGAVLPEAIVVPGEMD